ncbi:MAG TPA: hypothetical protein VGJ82_00340 [Thermoanaerobaculia bacterium]
MLVVLLLGIVAIAAPLVPVAMEQVRLVRIDHSTKEIVILLAEVMALVGLAVIFARTVVRSLRERPRVIPYFPKHLRSEGGTSNSERRNAFHDGCGLAADMAVLDRLATDAGVASLSQFGFSDDLMKQEVTWFDPTEGLQTVETLLRLLAADPGPISGVTLDDLRRLRGALQRAAETNTQFALIVRYGRDDFISGVEMERRAGTFWC